MPDTKFEELLRALEARRADVERGQRDGLQSVDMVALRDRAYQAWVAAEGYRLNTGCSPNRVP